MLGNDFDFDKRLDVEVNLGGHKKNRLLGKEAAHYTH